ncbi:phosphoserine phosphatase SerB [Pseudaestuariivita atlantica]|uniref:Phosphoserine phosphatase n=1 Tax=Pseudaestuariivita atlantica TaxID=1317121 RepID=A0A0L1JPZ3_9RHOB|nr:phosphoserine phosphatase SerB [Pseudaestuariivita atlantica]KNG93839.1 phosphoserine phosphatase [Pseudaestuariivita atlantica]
MFTTILTARPGALDPALAHSLRNAWGGGEVRWLAPDEAAEFDIATRPGNLAETWEGVQTMDVDLNVLPAEGRRKKMLLADMDSTMIEQECLDELADHVGVGDRVKAITARAMNGELDFEEAIDARVALLEGQPDSIIETVLESRITLMPGGPALLATMKANGAHAALVSGGFTAFTDAVARRLGFDEHRANTLLAKDGVLTGRVARPVLGREAKVEALEEITARLGLAPDDVLAVGDGANDLGMLGRAGLGVALHAKPAVQAACPVRVNFCDLTALLYLQGYAKDAFVAA